MSGDRPPSSSNTSSTAQNDGETPVDVNPATSPLTSSHQQAKPESEANQAKSDATTDHGRSTAEVVDEPE